MLEAIDNVQNKENPVYDDEDQVDFTFSIPNRHIAKKRRSPDSEVVGRTRRV